MSQKRTRLPIMRNLTEDQTVLTNYLSLSDKSLKDFIKLYFCVCIKEHLKPRCKVQ